MWTCARKQHCKLVCPPVPSYSHCTVASSGHEMLICVLVLGCCTGAIRVHLSKGTSTPTTHPVPRKYYTFLAHMVPTPGIFHVHKTHAWCLDLLRTFTLSRPWTWVGRNKYQTDSGRHINTRCCCVSIPCQLRGQKAVPLELQTNTPAEGCCRLGTCCSHIHRVYCLEPRGETHHHI